MSSPTTDIRPPAASGRAELGSLVVGILAVLALAIGVIALVTDDDGGGGETLVAGQTVAVELTEYAITPGTLTLPAGSTLEVENRGSLQHNLKIKGTDLGTSDLATGEDEALRLAALDPGTYELYCDIVGHESAGMASDLIVTEGGGSVAAGDAGGDHGGEDTDWAALDRAMTESMLAFPAETEGRGNEPLEFELADDGAKVFELTTEIVPWEVEPGVFVDAWTYNGMVPGPWIRVEPGDLVRIEVQNDLPMGTDIHWHGIQTPNDMDGVAPYTQELILAGESFTYEFVARKQAVGMYHAHHHAQMQVVNGMLGFFQIGDVPLPRGRTISGIEIPADLTVDREYPMILNDAGVIGFSLNGKSFPATEPLVATSGDWILIHYMNEGLQIHPMHQHQFPQLVVAKDGIPLDNPYWADTVNVAPGERYSVLINPNEAGTWVWHCHILTHVEREEGMFGMVTALIVE